MHHLTLQNDFFDSSGMHHVTLQNHLLDNARIHRLTLQSITIWTACQCATFHLRFSIDLYCDPNIVVQNVFFRGTLSLRILLSCFESWMKHVFHSCLAILSHPIVFVDSSVAVRVLDEAFSPSMSLMVSSGPATHHEVHGRFRPSTHNCGDGP